jgi:glutaminyl-tRNA synthetase
MTVHTPFPPEPNGYLHIGHAKAIVIDFGTAEKYGGVCNLRMEHHQPEQGRCRIRSKRSGGHPLARLPTGATASISPRTISRKCMTWPATCQKGLAYVCEQSPEQMRESRGTLTSPGTPSPWRDRSPEESLDLFGRMKAGEFADGSMVLRAKIDMTSGNMNMRDPVLYRILRAHHHRTGDTWCIYPMLRLCPSDRGRTECITHSLCSLEFEDHRPLYDWVVNHCDLPSQPRQIEFARLGINHTVMSKRKLRHLVENQLVSGWDDPRLPTLGGLRRRGYTPKSIRNFCERIGVSKVNSTVEYSFLEHCLREDLNATATRVMAPAPVKPDRQLPGGQTRPSTSITTRKTLAGTRGSLSRATLDRSRRCPGESGPRLFPPLPRQRGPLKAATSSCTACDKDENART